MENSKHLHKCGFPYHTQEGCGHVWEHSSDENATYDEYVASHTCPKCSRVVPMYADHFWQFHPQVERAVKDMPEPAFERIAALTV